MRKLSKNAREEFLRGLLPAARRVAARYGLPVSVMLAQAVLESNWGRSRLARTARNLFGIKAVSRHAESVTLPTCEYNGRMRVVAARFAAYASVEECLGDYARLLAYAPRYVAARAVADDPFAFAEQLAACGYATDPEYGKKISALMRRYGLTRFDEQDQHRRDAGATKTRGSAEHFVPTSAEKADKERKSPQGLKSVPAKTGRRKQ